MLFLIIFVSESALYTPHNSKHHQRSILGQCVIDALSTVSVHVASPALERLTLVAKMRNTRGIAAYTASTAYPMPSQHHLHRVNLVR